MPEPDVTQIKIDKQKVGVIGLISTFDEMSEAYAQKPDDEVVAELLNRLSKKNYIPVKARKNYGKALLREFRKYLGQPYEEVKTGELEIKVLGPGCSRCDQVEKDVMEVLAEMNLPADLEHVRDVKEIGKYGVMGTPALIINEKVVCVGKVPSKNKIKQWLEQAQ